MAGATVAVIALHGRGSNADDILSLADAIALPGVGWVAPEAADGAWYPNRFMAPMATNEPGLSSALRTVGRALADVAASGVPPERTILLGFSQGACLVTEFAARTARRYGGIACLSGGLIGPDGTSRDYPGRLFGTPAFLGCSDTDPHIPAARVRETADILRTLGAEVTLRLYPGTTHSVNSDQLREVRALLDLAMRAPSGSST